jgi:hypothetical protein
VWVINTIFIVCLVAVTAVMVVSWRVVDEARISGGHRWMLLSMSGFFLPLAGMFVAVAFHAGSS